MSVWQLLSIGLAAASIGFAGLSIIFTRRSVAASRRSIAHADEAARLWKIAADEYRSVIRAATKGRAA